MGSGWGGGGGEKAGQTSLHALFSGPRLRDRTVRIRTFAAIAVGGARLYPASRVRWGEGEKVCWCRDKIRQIYSKILISC